MYAIKGTDNNKNIIRSGLLTTAFSLKKISEIVLYGTVEQAESDIIYLKKAAKKVAPTMTFEVVVYENSVIKNEV